MENVYSDALEAVLRDLCTPADVRAIEAGASPAPLWDALQQSGFADSLLPDAGLALADALPMLVTMGQYALPVPLAQTMFARAVLQAAGVPLPDGPIALASREGAARAHVADGATAAWFLVQQDGAASLVARDAAAVQATGVHGDLTVSIGECGGQAFALAPGTLRTMGAALHSALLAGAMARTFDLTLQYANDRAQFGRNIGKFQAIQHQISVMAEQVAAVRMAAQIACAADGWQPERMRAAIGKCNASEAVAAVSAIAHAVHGALGITAEYDLQLFTRRLHAWRLADGSERYWAREIGAAVCDAQGGTVDQIRQWAGEAA
ncbi:acyl-CoA dehydrogenase family protein [Cupriavidus agavae]|uniref:Acyl-CoA dehydrogenase-like protein n=1 Tax=Cupriavidus agavae TaxID=1001822 RepID=A0A4V2FGD2_9BURK|nr:acyl-CoA dehydrogenase family protein [Cupriavidus agavae]RZT36369.1 acyl-CoA dehydrogenase-like protein [Cupriavidus agavae]